MNREKEVAVMKTIFGITSCLALGLIQFGAVPARAVNDTARDEAGYACDRTDYTTNAEGNGVRGGDNDKNKIVTHAMVGSGFVRGNKPALMVASEVVAVALSQAGCSHGSDPACVPLRITGWEPFQLSDDAAFLKPYPALGVRDTDEFQVFLDVLLAHLPKDAILQEQVSRAAKILSARTVANLVNIIEIRLLEYDVRASQGGSDYATGAEGNGVRGGGNDKDRIVTNAMVRSNERFLANPYCLTLAQSASLVGHLLEEACPDKIQKYGPDGKKIEDRESNGKKLGPDDRLYQCLPRLELPHAEIAQLWVQDFLEKRASSEFGCTINLRGWYTGEKMEIGSLVVSVLEASYRERALSGK
jgi:hypothetical protein